LDQRSVVPQMMWIDRKGMVRAQTPAAGDMSMLTETYYRQTIATLLAEPATESMSGKQARRPAASSKR
jgi:hypothetical protein